MGGRGRVSLVRTWEGASVFVQVGGVGVMWGSSGKGGS